MIRFGPSGNSKKFYDDGNKSSYEAPAWLKKIGLSAYEYSFGRGYTMNMDNAKKLGAKAKENNILVSVHAPFYINLANPDEKKVEKSYGYITKGLEYLKAMQGQHLVFHISSQGQLSREEALNLTRLRLKNLLEKIDFSQYQNIYLCPETMGKSRQIGTYEEIIDICAMDSHLIPTFDFGHINCLMQGELNKEEDYEKIFNYSFEKLGEFRTKNCHIHFSKIEFSDKGEVKHLNYDDEKYGPDFTPLAKVILKLNLTPTVICESKDFMAEDALILKNIYETEKNIRQLK